MVFWGKGRRRTKQSVDIEGRRKEEERGTERKREDKERSRKNVKEERRGVGFSCSI